MGIALKALATGAPDTPDEVGVVALSTADLEAGPENWDNDWPVEPSVDDNKVVGEGGAPISAIDRGNDSAATSFVGFAAVRTAGTDAVTWPFWAATRTGECALAAGGPPSVSFDSDTNVVRGVGAGNAETADDISLTVSGEAINVTRAFDCRRSSCADSSDIAVNRSASTIPPANSPIRARRETALLEEDAFDGWPP